MHLVHKHPDRAASHSGEISGKNTAIKGVNTQAKKIVICDGTVTPSCTRRNLLEFCKVVSLG